MGGPTRFALLLGALATALALAILVGAAERGAADTVSGCAGKPLCVSVTDQGVTGSTETQASYTTTASDHFLTDSVVVSNGGTTSNLVNITVTVTWTDEGGSSQSSEFRPEFSDPNCTLSGDHTITCTAPKSLGPGGSASFLLVFRTATDTSGAADTKVTAEASAKEQQNSNKQGPPKNTAFTSASNATPYEGDPNFDVSIAGGGISTVALQTAQTGSQFSRLAIPATGPREFYTLLEQDYATPITCGTSGRNCIGQQVTIVATGLSPVNLQITYTGPITSGLNENNLDVVHTRDDGNTVDIQTKCNDTTLFSGVQPSNIPCRLVDINKQTNTIRVDFWDTSNGSVKIG